MLSAALFTVARTWKQPKYPLTEEGIKKMWHIHTMEYYSAVKRNEIVPFSEKWMDLEAVIQWSKSEREQQIYIITYVWNLEKWFGWTCLHSRNRDTDVKNKHGYQRGTRGRYGLGDWGWHIYTVGLSRVQLSESPWIVAHPASLSMKCSRQEYCSGLPHFLL